jgi:hypothetical protein
VGDLIPVPGPVRFGAESAFRPPAAVAFQDLTLPTLLGPSRSWQAALCATCHDGRSYAQNLTDASTDCYPTQPNLRYDSYNVLLSRG